MATLTYLAGNAALYTCPSVASAGTCAAVGTVLGPAVAVAGIVVQSRVAIQGLKQMASAANDAREAWNDQGDLVQVQLAVGADGQVQVDIEPTPPPSCTKRALNVLKQAPKILFKGYFGYMLAKSAGTAYETAKGLAGRAISLFQKPAASAVLMLPAPAPVLMLAAPPSNVTGLLPAPDATCPNYRYLLERMS